MREEPNITNLDPSLCPFPSNKPDEKKKEARRGLEISWRKTVALDCKPQSSRATQLLLHFHWALTQQGFISSPPSLEVLPLKGAGQERAPCRMA